MTTSARALARDVDRAVRRRARRHEWTWRYGLNLRPTLAYRWDRTRLDEEQARVVADLDRDGFARSSLDALVDPAGAQELLDATDRLLAARAPDIEAARSRRTEAGDGSQKPYVLTLSGSAIPAPEDPLTRFALRPEVVAIAHAYYGMHLRLRYCDVWHTLLATEAPSQSQLWHRDPEDRQILKVFVALSDVDDGAGPFSYAPGTHARGAVTGVPEHVAVDGSTPRSTDEQMAAVVARERWRVGTGPRGTILFADTRGYHKGGYARSTERTLYVCQYLSRAAGRGGLTTAGTS